MHKNAGILDKLALAADLPGESVPGQSLVEILGDRRVLLENHYGVTKYSQESICVKVRYGQIQISGCGLRLMKMTKQQIIICGRIEAVSLFRGDGK